MTETKLRKYIEDKGIMKKYLYSNLGLCYNAFEKRLNDPKLFTIGQADSLCNLLGITSAKEKIELFF